MGAFGIDIPLTRENGKKMIGYSEAFKDNVKKLTRKTENNTCEKSIKGE